MLPKKNKKKTNKMLNDIYFLRCRETIVTEKRYLLMGFSILPLRTHHDTMERGKLYK